ncbi:amino acid ABC transporter ATP-binding protein [Desulfobaculum bizertense]|uniref:Amino acid ABC transporter ATP-binding protein, PAAT family (TC 3.A.1.3.-) n=1 Tax=Desulfobaculum bizertense DSM 18034 TaxID=1121442 RepID=A0A1T4WZN4_9BACT|nr:amino acid ABC transporter ATP-binding protein [Desulfobaculum bizertense]UIJ37354.1 amino acid ABC transporter ATP-binding protein [Desulfobaculum bizertense]SKA82812.1 amino acid ABC transporter ATP-binding protein, PAAT family (TC 3.A.1.3.-) [Desulfobaculum bizertense DSM 18034]
MSDTSVLRIEGLNKSFGENYVLKDASLTLKRGELKVLIGPSGGGKSTLLQCMNFLIPPDTGRFWLNGQEVDPSDKKSLYSYRQKVGMIFQDFNLFDHLSAVENVRIALVKVLGMSKKDAMDRAMAELERVGMAGRANLYPAQLSGGQKQRVSIARALAMDPEVLLLDEPTSALDPELIGEVLTVIRDLSQAGMTMIMATHQITFSSQLADEFIFMQQGRIIEQGSPKELLAAGVESRTQEFCSKINELTGEPV